MGDLPDAIDTRPHARHVIDDALTDWRDQSDEDMPAWMYNPDTVKELARFIRDRLEAAVMVATGGAATQAPGRAARARDEDNMHPPGTPFGVTS
jgi:hypothetical protein